MFYRILDFRDIAGGPVERHHPPHIFSADDDKAAEAHARKVWEQWFEAGDWPNDDGQATRVEGLVRMDGPWFNKECTSPGFDCGEWLLSCHGERSQNMAPLEDVLEDAVTRVGIVGFILLATAPGWWPIIA